MEYLIHQEKMNELNAIIGQQGGPATSAASDAMAATQIALAAGDTAKATQEMNKAIEANKIDGKAWSNVQKWHNNRINEDQYGGDSPDPGGNTGGGGIPPNAIQTTPGAGNVLLTAEGGNVAINGKNYAAYVQRGKDSGSGMGPVYHFIGDFDGDMASLSCDGRKIAFSVTDGPGDPGQPYNGNAVEHRPYKAGQYCNVRIGEGGYSDEVMIIYNITKFG
jgi:hypothetical protein